MLSFAAPRKYLLAPLVICLAVSVFAPALAQDPPRTPTARPEEAEDVVRVSTDLVQTDVMVFDKQGKFVDGLRPEQFDLRVDGKPQAFSFFELIQAGTVDEEAQLSAARGGYNRTPGGAAGTVLPLDRGRTLFFFVDDLHLSPPSATRVRETLLRFIAEELKQNDEAAVTSASGQIGFLQQLTNDKAVLRAAVARLSGRSQNVRDFQHPQMSEVQALAVDRGDNQVVDFFVDAILRETPQMRRETAEQMVMSRARMILQQSSSIATNTLLSLESLVRRSAPLPGRKIVFFLSDGFLLDERNGTTRDRLRRLTDAAARAGAVIYSMDAQGLTTGIQDASEAGVFDPGGRLSSVNMGATRAMQEPLFTLAHDTGGRALLNTNALNLAVERVLRETSVYYLLAWRPGESDERGGPKFRRIEISVKGRPDLNVMVRRGFYNGPAEEEAARVGAKKGKEKESAGAPAQSPAERELRDAIGAAYARQGFPTSLSLGYITAPGNEMVLTASVELNREALGLLTAGAQGSASVDVAGAVFDDRGKPVGSFRQELSIPHAYTTRSDRRRVTYSNQFRLAPGLYQVRVAARDRQGGRTGSAMQWVVIPDLRQGQFSLGSIFVGERTTTQAAAAEKGDVGQQPQQPIVVSVDRRFARSSWMRFMTFIYNAAGGAAAPPDVALQVQVFRDDQPVITAPLSKIATAELQDHKRIPYAAELALASLPAGRYVLQLTAIDRHAKMSSSQRVNFTVE